MIKKDCFACGNNGCKVLTELLCKNKKCTFYKTSDQLKEQKDKCDNRLFDIGLKNKYC